MTNHSRPSRMLRPLGDFFEEMMSVGDAQKFPIIQLDSRGRPPIRIAVTEREKTESGPTLRFEARFEGTVHFAIGATRADALALLFVAYQQFANLEITGYPESCSEPLFDKP